MTQNSFSTCNRKLFFAQIAWRSIINSASSHSLSANGVVDVPPSPIVTACIPFKCKILTVFSESRLTQISKSLLSSSVPDASDMVLHEIGRSRVNGGLLRAESPKERFSISCSAGTPPDFWKIPERIFPAHCWPVPRPFSAFQPAEWPASVRSGADIFLHAPWPTRDHYRCLCLQNYSLTQWEQVLHHLSYSESVLL